MAKQSEETDLDIRWLQRLHHFQRAFGELEAAVSLKKYSKLERSGLIQTFEFTFELAWKTLQDLLISRGYEGIAGPRPVLKQAFKDGLIGSGEQWQQMLLSRNMSVHSYNEKVAEELKEQITHSYFSLLKDLIARLTKEAGR